MEHYSQLHLKAPATEPEHVVRKAEFDRIADRYSTTEEVNTGKTWIDGKPIYRSYFYFGTFTASALSWQYKNHGIADVGQLVDYSCLSAGTTAPHLGSPTELYPVPNGHSNTAWVTMCQLPDVRRVALSIGSSAANRHYWFWIEYTKTTDPLPREIDS